jgi:Glycosyltransferase family 87
LLAILASASTWGYVNLILKAEQVADAAVHKRPRGNLSDLYPRWLGARELLLHHRNPYSAQVTVEIQKGYYGRTLNPQPSDDPKDQQGFAYPVYVVFLLGPTIQLPFEAVRVGFRWLLIGLAGVSVCLWLRTLRWKPPGIEILILIVLALGWLPMVQGIKLQQLSLLVAGLLAACGACVAGGWLFLGGGLLALGTIKPQLAWPLVAWLLLWSVSDWRARRRLVFAFALVMVLLLAGAELLLPGWLRMFVSAIGQYHQYTGNQSVLVWMFGRIVGWALEALTILASAAYLWRVRRSPASSVEFGVATALVLAMTVVVVPMFAPYNQVLLLPAILALTRSATASKPILPAIRLAGGVGGFLLIWPWIASLGLMMGYFGITPELRQRLWPMPFYSNFMVPIFIFGLALFDAWSNAPYGLREGAAAE